MQGEFVISKQTTFNVVVLAIVLSAIAFFATRKEVVVEPVFPAPYIRPLPKKCDCSGCQKSGQLGEVPPVVKSL